MSVLINVIWIAVLLVLVTGIGVPYYKARRDQQRSRAAARRERWIARPARIDRVRRTVRLLDLCDLLGSLPRDQVAALPASALRARAELGARTSRSSLRRAVCCRLLGHLGAAETITTLKDNLGHRDPDVRHASRQALVAIGGSAAARALIGAVREVPHEQRRYVEAIVRMSSIQETTWALVSERRAPSRAALAEAIGLIGASEPDLACDTLLTLLGSEEESDRIAAARGLGRVAHPRSILPLLHSLLSDASPVVRSQAAASLGRFADEAIVPALAEAMHDSFWWTAAHAAAALRDSGPDGHRVLGEIARTSEFLGAAHAQEALDELALAGVAGDGP